MENGFFDSFFTAELDNGEKKLFRVHGKGDPGYKVTSKFVCESALTLVRIVKNYLVAMNMEAFLLLHPA